MLAGLDATGRALWVAAGGVFVAASAAIVKRPPRAAAYLYAAVGLLLA